MNDLFLISGYQARKIILNFDLYFRLIRLLSQWSEEKKNEIPTNNIL